MCKIYLQDFLVLVGTFFSVETFDIESLKLNSANRNSDLIKTESFLKKKKKKLSFCLHSHDVLYYIFEIIKEKLFF